MKTRAGGLVYYFIDLLQREYFFNIFVNCKYHICEYLHIIGTYYVKYAIKTQHFSSTVIVEQESSVQTIDSTGSQAGRKNLGAEKLWRDCF